MSDEAAYHVLVCALFPVQGGMWNCVHIPPCTGNNTWYAASSLMITGSLIILIRDFSWELYVLPDDDMRCAIETYRSSESVLM